MEKLNIATLAPYFTDEGVAWELVEKMVWKGTPVCPHCGVIGGHYLLKNAPTSTGKVSYRRTWKCADCRKKFSVLIGTIFEKTQIPMHKWLMAMFLLSASKNGVAAFELHRTLNVTHKTAWFMIHRIREGMKVAPFAAMMKGTVIADETYFGGKPSNRHRKAGELSKRGGGTDKTPVVSILSKDSGEVRSQAVANVTGNTLHGILAGNVEMAESTLHTDTSSAYETFSDEFKAHEMVNHKRREYVRNGVTTNPVEGFFSQLKRSIDGTHHHVSVDHLPRYLAEHDFRYSTRMVTDSERMVKMMGQVSGKRLTYKRLIAK